MNRLLPAPHLWLCSVCLCNASQHRPRTRTPLLTNEHFLDAFATRPGKTSGARGLPKLGEPARSSDRSLLTEPAGFIPAWGTAVPLLPRLLGAPGSPGSGSAGMLQPQLLMEERGR